MSSSDYTIASGLQALLAKAKYHHDEASRFDLMVVAFREAELALNSSNGDSRVGRPIKDVDRKKLDDAISSMPEIFSLPEVKKAANLRIDVFRRLFRDARKDGKVIEEIAANGRQPGRYRKPVSAVKSKLEIVN